MTNMKMPWYAKAVFVGGRPLVLVAALVMSVPGEIRMAEIAGWQGWITWLMPVCVSAYAACAAVIATQRHLAKAPGRVTATIGAGVALALALSAQVVAHLIDRGYMTTSALLVAVVSSVPPLVVAHMLHMAAMPAEELAAWDRVREVEQTAAYLAGELAEALDLAGRQLLSKSHGVANGYDELAEIVDELAADVADLVDEIAEELAEAATAESKPRRQRTQRKAVPLAVVKTTIAAMKASGEKITGQTLAERLGCSERSGYRYLGEAQAA
ncbi:helix-turn-helix domain-containing protein [Streptomyces sp. AP-93]|uniref:helix-turn-helix domain-containing protein n=1 Tax=Streptomyces sp. AP-93 TaxID=2929048 RepID=UPI001FAEAD20|nr:helix-turn-helix domain-containing protein [Streptomyces sp. AP-93]MCJ0870270.1 helix-turn-helix domain-containing protein [Streptomyces sp. AP-93]